MTSTPIRFPDACSPGSGTRTNYEMATILTCSHNFSSIALTCASLLSRLSILISRYLFMPTQLLLSNFHYLFLCFFPSQTIFIPLICLLLRSFHTIILLQILFYCLVYSFTVPSLSFFSCH